MTIDWDSQETAWNKHLSRLAKEVSIPEGLIWSSRQQLITVFGKEWLEQELIKKKSASPLKKGGIVSVITNPIVNNAVGVVELAKYLKAFSGQPNFNEIVTKLKNASDYEAIRLNLALGYRLKAIGWQNVVVEPALGDVEGIFHGQRYIVECGMFNPPTPARVYTQAMFDSFYKYLKKNKLKTWLHVEFLSNPLDTDRSMLVKNIKKLNNDFALSGKKTEFKTENYKIKIEELTDEKLQLLMDDREKDQDNIVDVGISLANHTPNVLGDIYSVDLDDESKRYDVGWVTFGGVEKNSNDKSTEEQLRIKIRDKKEQTKNHPNDTRRMFVFQAKGMIDSEDIRSIGAVVRTSIKPSDYIDNVILLDRRHQTAFDKLRYTSGQYHILTTSIRVPRLEKMVEDMKKFEYSDWINE